MKIAELRRLSPVQDTTATARTTSEQDAPIIRDTSGQDTAIKATPARWYFNRKIQTTAGAGVLLVALLAYLLVQWGETKNLVSAERLRIVTVNKGHFTRDVAAQGTVIAAVNPTLFATAPGTISYLVRAGDSVTKGQPIASLDSPSLKNEYEREHATLDSLNAALERQEIEIRRQMLKSRQEADLAKVNITAAEREKGRAQTAWDERVISERDYRRAVDDLDTAKLNYDHATSNADLDRDSLALDLRTKRLERDRQRLVVENLSRRVDELTLKSPVDGMVANLGQAEKARVAESAPLITVVDLTAFEIEFQVAETYAGEIKSGMTADITLDGRKYAGAVTAISPEVRQSQVVGRVKFTNAQPPGLRQNQRASVRIVLDERDDVLKFERGSSIDETTPSLFVVRDDRAVRVPVQLGAASVSEIEVLRGLAAGDRVIASDMRDYDTVDQISITR
jgi:HlyD family secretion protein